MTTLIYFIAVYITFICFAFVIYGFLFRKTKVHSPYELLKKRRIETENYDRKIDYHGKKLLAILIIPVYFLILYWLLISRLAETLALVDALAVFLRDYGLVVYGITFAYLGVETFFSYKEKKELSAFFFEALRLGGLRQWAAFCGILSFAAFGFYHVLLLGHDSVCELNHGCAVVAVYLIAASVLMLAFHIALVVYTGISHVRYDTRNAKRDVVMHLSSKELCKSCVRDGTKELKRAIFGAIMEYYDIYSKKVLGRWLYRLDGIHFMSPIEELCFPEIGSDGIFLDEDMGKRAGHGLDEEQKIWYQKALFRMLRQGFVLLAAELVLFTISLHMFRGLEIILSLLPSVAAAFLFIISIEYLLRNPEENYEKVVVENFPGWAYVFSYRNRRNEKGNRPTQKAFAWDDPVLFPFQSMERSYIQTIHGFMEYVRQVKEYADSEALESRLYRDLFDHLSKMDRLGRYEMAQYRSILILYGFVLCQERRMLNGGMENRGYRLQAFEEQAFRFCTEGLSMHEVRRLHDFLYDITLDYYGAVDEKAGTHENGYTLRKYEANRFFEDYWSMLNG